MKKTVPNDQLEFEMMSFKSESGEYAEQWFPVDDGALILRSSIVAVSARKGDRGPFVAWA